MVNYQKDDNAGTAFMSKTFPNANGDTDIFKYTATLDEQKDFYNKREVFGTILNARYNTGEKNYFSANTTYFNNSADSHFDGDRSTAPAIDMAELVRANQFMQELRYHFSYGSRFTGIAGASFWREDVNHLYTFIPEEQYLAPMMMQSMMPELIPSDYSLFVNNKPNPLRQLVLPGYIAGLPVDFVYFDLPAKHVEENYTEAANSAYDLFFDASYEIISKLTFTAGVRATFEKFTITNRADFVDGEPSVLGVMNPANPHPNFFFKPVVNPERIETFSALTWRGVLKYDLDNRSGVYAGYSNGRKPNVLQYDSKGDYTLIKAETLHSFDAGYRIVMQRLMFDASLYYQLYRNFQSWKWEGMDYLQEGIDRATSYGMELSARYYLNSYLNIFGNYAFAMATFDDRDNDGRPQLNGGNTFRLTPKNSFLIGFNAGVDVANNIRITLTPTYTWKSHFFFEDANDEGIEQDAYGLLNVNLSLLFKRQRLSVSLFGSNLTRERYLIGAGNMGAMFGIPTFVPGAPAMTGAKLTWNF